MLRKSILIILILVGEVTVSDESFPVEITPGDRATVSIYVVHILGLPLKDAEIKLTRKGKDGKPEETKKFSTYTLKDIPYGNYTLDVSRSGFYRSSREIVIDQPELWFTVGLLLAEISGTGIDFETLGGRILPFDFGSNDTRWVRLASIYSDLILEAALDRSSGEFSFKKVPCGSYILLTLSGGNLCDMRRVDVNAEGPRWVTINLTSGPCVEKKKDATLLLQK